MVVFYTTRIEGERAILEGEEARHAIQVLRKKTGDTLRFTDGNGSWFEGIIEGEGKKDCQILILERQKTLSRRNYSAHIALAPTKNLDRLEWFLEKATEIGIDDITPVWCQHAERHTLRPDRLEKILISAMKQSLQCFLPRLHPALSLKNFLETLTETTDQRFIGYMDARMGSRHLLEAYTPGKNVVVLIGPEGDFSPEEVEMSMKYGFQTVTLGPNRLRTETAALTAAQIIALRNEV